MNTTLIAFVIGFLVFIFWLAAYLGSPKVRGRKGEKRVTETLGRKLDSNQYRLFHDLTLPSGRGDTQIDHVIVSPYGVFVIETKNYSGWIFGNSRSKVWTQTIWGNKSRFQNPLRQNYKHTKAIESFLGLGSECVYSVVVFVGSADFRTTMPPNVVYLSGLCPYIRSKAELKIGKEKFWSCVDRLQRQKIGLATEKPTAARAQVVKQKSNCPICGEEMALRTARKGKSAGQQFWGCTKFPKCRGTRNLSDS